MSYSGQNRKLIDLSVPIERHWRYPLSVDEVKSFHNGNLLNIKSFTLFTHWYTHIDAPLHYVDGGKSLDDFPLLEMLIGKATILNVSEFVSPNQPITAEHIKTAANGLPIHEMVFIRTDWGRRRSWKTKEFWEDAPYVTREAAVYLRSLSPKVVGFDFPQDYDIRRAASMREEDIDYTTHSELLKNNILMIEYMNNMWELSQSVVDIVALPMGIAEADGAQIRVVAIEGID